MERKRWTEAAVGIMTALTGLGVLTIALAPLALPILILTIASLVPLLAVGLAAGIPIALIAAVWLALRALRRRWLGPSDRRTDRNRPATRTRSDWRARATPSSPGFERSAR